MQNASWERALRGRTYKERKSDVVAPSHDLSNQEAEVGEQEIKASLDYITSSWPTWATYRNHVSKQTSKKH